MNTETTERRSFLGIIVAGDIDKSYRKEQRSKEEFAAIVQAVLDDPKVVEFGWRQYTPYFNDGETCVFSAHTAWARLDTDPPTTDDEDDENDDYEDSLDIDYRDDLGSRARTWTGGGKYTDAPYEGPDEARYDRMKALARAIDSDAFCDVLLDLFGDHASVRVRRDGIQVDSYEHD